MMNNMPPMGGGMPPMGGGQNPQSQDFLMRLLQALFGGSLGQSPGGMGAPPMGGGMPAGGLPKMGMEPLPMDRPNAGPPAGPPPTIGQGPFQQFDRGLPKRTY